MIKSKADIDIYREISCSTRVILSIASTFPLPYDTVISRVIQRYFQNNISDFEFLYAVKEAVQEALSDRYPY